MDGLVRGGDRLICATGGKGGWRVRGKEMIRGTGERGTQGGREDSKHTNPESVKENVTYQAENFGGSFLHV